MKKNDSPDSDLLRNQFIITQDNDRIPEAWERRQLKDWFIGMHPSLTCCTIADLNAGNEVQGLLIGFPVADGQLQNCVWTIDTSKSSLDDCIEDQIYRRVSGRFIFVLFQASSGRVYLDASGSLSAVYSVSEKSVYASPAVAGKNNSDADFTALADRLPMKRLHFGYTNYSSLKRIVPNHYLDMQDWTLHRHYPLKNDFSELLPVSGAIDMIVADVQQTAKGLLPRGLYMSLTAGADCRLVMACCRSLVDEMIFINNPINNNAQDKEAAERLVDMFGLNYIGMGGSRKPEGPEEELFRQMLGYTSATLRELPADTGRLTHDAFHITGVNGELAKGKLYEPHDLYEDKPLRADELLRKLGVPLEQEWLDACDSFLSPLLHLDRCTILDLFLIEQAFGCLSGPETYPYDAFAITSIHGFSSRPVLEAIMRLDKKYKFEKRLAADVCRQEWPELLNIPINGIFYTLADINCPS